MSDEHGHTRRVEDFGFGRMLKYLPYLFLIFSCGAWYESSRANNALISRLNLQIVDHDTRITKVEDAVIYLKELVAIRRGE